jgi:sugar-specific transcriptional regulator TrmB
MMMDNAKIVKKYLEKLAIEAEATEVYLKLAQTGYSSALQLAKATGISRTQIYRHLEVLKSVGLVSAEQLTYGTLYRALPLENIEGLLADREAETAAIRRNLSSMAKFVQSLAGVSDIQKAKVRHYYGVAGLKQANWNLTKADKEYRVFEAAHLDQHLGKAFARKHRERCIELELTSYDLTNATSVTAKELEPVDISRSPMRHIDPEILTINFEMYIYNNTVTLLDYRRGQEMAIEIEHPILHAMMRQLFDAMWNQATPLEIKP